jgi:hypothetical protein
MVIADLQASEPLLSHLERGPKAPSGRTSSAPAYLTLVQNRSFSGNSVAVAIAVAVVLVIGLVVATSLAGMGDWSISPAGWVAIGFGVIVTLALGVGLMALVFISSRRGYDELAGGSRVRPQDGENRN